MKVSLTRRWVSHTRRPKSCKRQKVAQGRRKNLGRGEKFTDGLVEDRENFLEEDEIAKG
jgi:hypothetical protein